MLIWEVQQKIKGVWRRFVGRKKFSFLKINALTLHILNLLLSFSFLLVEKTENEAHLLSLFSQKPFLEERNVKKCLICKTSRISCKLGQDLPGMA